MPGTNVVSPLTGAVRVMPLWPINTYLVPDGKGTVTLIDTAIRGSERQLLRAAATLGQGRVDKIVLTHYHEDHSGSLDALRQLLPTAEILFGQREARLLAGDMSLDPDEPQGRLVARGMTSTRPTGTLKPGDMVGSLRVYAAPGHSPGQIALLDQRDGTLYCADSYSTVGGVATTAGPDRRFPLPGYATWNRRRAHDSARELYRLDPVRLAPGHGPVVDNPAVAMLKAIQSSISRAY